MPSICNMAQVECLANSEQLYQYFQLEVYLIYCFIYKILCAYRLLPCFCL